MNETNRNETNRNETDGEHNKMKKVDIAVKVLFIVARAVIYFFWKCEYDPLVTILGILILVGASVLTYMQFHKLDELTDTMSSGEMKS